MSYFGGARVITSDLESSTAAPNYTTFVAPEAYSNHYDTKCDIWAYGLTISKLACPSLEFHYYVAPGSYPRAVIPAVLLSQLPPSVRQGCERLRGIAISNIPPEFPDLKLMIQNQCLEFDPKLRSNALSIMDSLLMMLAEDGEEYKRDVEETRQWLSEWLSP